MASRSLLGPVLQLPLTAGLALIAAAVSVLYWTDHGIGPLTMSYRAFVDQPWRLITSIFPHADPMHLFFNLYWLWFLGRWIEKHVGVTKMALLVLVLAVGSGAAEYAIFDGGIGLSGVGYGLFGFCYRRQQRPDMEQVVDRRMAMIFIGWFFFCIGATLVNLMAVANVAHGAGAILGLLLGELAGVREKRRRWLLAVALALTLGGIAAFATVLRPYVNFSDSWSAASSRGTNAVDVDNNQAVHWLRKAVAHRPDHDASWYNLGVAYQRLDQLEKALAAFEKAHRLKPRNRKYLETYHSTRRLVEQQRRSD